MGVQDCCTTRSIEPGLMGWGESGVCEGESVGIGESYEWNAIKNRPLRAAELSRVENLVYFKSASMSFRRYSD